MQDRCSAMTVVIPAYRPDERLPRLVRDLSENGFDRIIVVDDGSGIEYETIFARAESYGCRVVTHDKNRGKGAALRTGIRAGMEIARRTGLQLRSAAKMRMPESPAEPAAGTRGTAAEETGLSGVITADADGQHTPEDIAAVACAMRHFPEALILGSRNFDASGVPWKSRTGNRITAAFFKMSTGKAVRDTQTGLRGIPASLLPLALAETGDRYEYEMNFLTDAAKYAEIREIPIRTIYENDNKGSHFRPFADSIRIYGRPLRFAAVSGISCAADLALFTAFRMLFAQLPLFSGGSVSGSWAETLFFGSGIGSGALAVMAAVVCARLLSGVLNFALNRKWTFASHGKAKTEAGRYLLLFFGIMAASAVGTAACARVLPATSAKVLTDAVLFVINYRVQQRWVFSAAPEAISEKRFGKGRKKIIEGGDILDQNEKTQKNEAYCICGDSPFVQHFYTA